AQAPGLEEMAPRPGEHPHLAPELVLAVAARLLERERLGLVDRAAAALHHQRREAEVVPERPLDVVGSAYRVDRAVAARDRAEPRLALAQPELIAPVDAFLVRPVLALKLHLPADVGDVGVGEAANELAQCVRSPGGVRVAERDDLAFGLADRAVHRRELSGPLAREELDAPVVAPDDLVRAVGRAVGGDDEVELVL